MKSWYNSDVGKNNIKTTI